MLDNSTLLILLLFAHLVGDVLVRPEIVSKYKNDSLLVLIFHCFIYAGVVITLYTFYVPILEFVFAKFMFLFISHLFIDLVSSILNPAVSWVVEGKVKVNKWYVMDQFMHSVMIVVLVYGGEWFWAEGGLL